MSNTSPTTTSPTTTSPTTTSPTTTSPTTATDPSSGGPGPAIGYAGTGHPVSWFEIHTADPERTKSFYGDVFGWRFDDSMPGYTFISTADDAPIGGGIAHSGGAYPNDAVFCVQVADVAAALAATKAAGGSVVVDAQSAPGGVSFGYAANPDGAVFGVWSPPAG